MNLNIEKVEATDEKEMRHLFLQLAEKISRHPHMASVYNPTILKQHAELLNLLDDSLEAYTCLCELLEEHEEERTANLWFRDAGIAALADRYQD